MIYLPEGHDSLESFLCSLEQEVDCLPVTTILDGEQSDTLNLTNTARKLSRAESEMGQLTMHQSSETSEISTENTQKCIEGELMSFQVDFLASPFLQQGREWARTIQGTCGPQQLSALGRYDQESAGWRTFQDSFLLDTSEQLLEIFPKAGLVLDGVLYPQPNWERNISVIDSGLWLTPSATNISERSEEAIERRKEYRESIGRKTVPPGGLAEQVQYGEPTVDMFPTPSSSLAGEGDVLDKLVDKDGNEPQPNQRAYNSETGKHVQVNLNRAVKLWPTPRAVMPDNLSSNPVINVNGRIVRASGENFGINLQDAVKLFPTPSTQEIEHPDIEVTETGRRKHKDPNAKYPDNSINLADTVKMFPTPTASERSGINPNTGNGAGLSKTVKLWPTPDASQRGTRKPESLQRRLDEGHPIDLEDAVNTYPTPTARDWKDTRGMAFEGINPDGSRRDRTDLLSTRIYSTEKKEGKLNPDWVELLMGWPLGWTSLTPMSEVVFRGWDAGWEDGVPRVDVNIEERANRLKAIGNGQVPQCMAMAWVLLTYDLFTPQTAAANRQ